MFPAFSTSLSSNVQGVNTCLYGNLLTKTSGMNSLSSSSFPLTLASRELYCMFSHLNALRISHGDVRWANIVSAPESPSGFRGHYCPHHGVDHPWRIIDFDLSTKSTKSPEDCHYHYTSMIDLLLLQLSRGLRWNLWTLFQFRTYYPTSLARKDRKVQSLLFHGGMYNTLLYRVLHNCCSHSNVV